MTYYVADTVAMILRLEKRTLGNRARQAFVEVEQGNANLYLPGMVFAEIMYLSERKRIVATLVDVRAYMQHNPTCHELPLSFDIVTHAQSITDIPELHDRLIAATAIHLRAPLITTDTVISQSKHLKTMWE